MACNGLFICGLGYRMDLPQIVISHKEGPISVEHPSLLVNDKDGLMPLKIQRDGLAEKTYPFQQELVESIVGELCRELYIALSSPLTPKNFAEVLERTRLCLHKYGRPSGAALGLSKRGWLPLEPALLCSYGPTCVLIDPIQRDRDGLICELDESVLTGDILLVPQVLNSSGLSIIQAWVRGLLLGEEWSIRSPYLFNKQPPQGMLLFLTAEADDFIRRPGGGLPKYLRENFELKHKGGSWRIYQIGSIVVGVTVVENLLAYAIKSDARAFCLYFPAPYDNGKDLSTPFSKAWLSLAPGGFREP